MGIKHIDFRDPSSKYTLVSALNYYSQNFDYKDSKQFALEWIETNLPNEYTRLKEARDYQFSNRGFICKMLDNGLSLSQNQKDDLIKFFTSMQINNKVEYEEIEEKVKTKQQVKINKIIYQMEDVIDDILSDKEPESIDIPVDKTQLNESISWLEKQIIDAQEQIIKQQEILESLMTVYEKCGGIREKMVIKRKTKIKTVKNSISEKSKIAQSVKYKKEDDELKLSSISPIQIMGAKEVILYDSKYKKLTHLISEKGNTLDVKGTTVKNVDLEKSSCRRISKPQTFFENKNSLMDKMAALTSTSRTASTRINQETLILEVIK